MADEECVNVPESLLRREQERTEKLLRKKEADVDGQANQEYLQLFANEFKDKQKEIQNGLEEAVNLDNRQRCILFQKIAADLNLLHRHVASASALLTPYDVRRFKDSMVELERLRNKAKQSLMPKQKFGFKKKILKPNGADRTAAVNEVNCTDLIDGLGMSFLNIVRPGPGFDNRINERLELSGEQISGREVTLFNLTNCTVIIHGCPSSVFARSIINTTLLLSPVPTSVLLYGVTDCKVSSFCHQMRIHDSNSSDFYIHVATDPIIENCRNVRFAPYSYSYPSLNRDIETSGLDPSINKWENVKDFDWLVASHPSPNWTVLPLNQRLNHWAD